MTRDADPIAAALAIPGRARALLGPYLEAERLARMEAVLARRTRHVVALLDRLHDPHNYAACARTADALGIQELHAIPEGGRGRLPELGRAVSMRAERWLSWSAHVDADVALATLRAGGYRLAVTALGDDGATATPIDALPVDAPIAIAFGNERDGVDARLVAAADYRVVWPMRGFAQSLNVSVAFALIVAKVRERLEAEVAPERWALPDDVRIALLDRWIAGDVTHARAILAELARRERLADDASASGE